MLKKSFVLLTLAAACTLAQAQSTPAKKELSAKILKLQQAGIEAMARDLVKQPANELIAGALDYVQQQVPQDKREAIGKGLQQDADKYMNDTFPVVRDKAIKLAPATVGAMLEEKFTEDELKQVVTMMESPVYQKFQTMGGDMQRVLLAKLVPDVRADVGSHLRVLDESIAKRLGVQPATGSGGAAGGAPAAAAPAAPAAKPAPKK
ncbi:hypothetical protein [Ramlibacter agri]|uniref:hypothetical protein n=1 Tax=Ramlibacter agri TaxID=2728837 RepID=UPI0019803198|nr:hypothetical protein [Ramlibacter agri]